MHMPPWAYCESLLEDQVVVEDSEAHHLINVLRLKVGESVTLFDGRGTTARASIQALSRRDVTLRIQERTHCRPDSSPRITMAVAAPKGDRLKWMVEKLTELGLQQLQMMECHRSVAAPGETRIDKLNASVIAACKQCRRATLMELSPMQSFERVVNNAIQNHHRIYIAHPGADAASCFSDEPPSDVTILIGPEGGFTDEEVQLAVNAGAIRVVWPGTILRIETAAIVFGTLAVASSQNTPETNPNVAST
jgi:16S rRNA (uracil1498-N3)-methyltransferase